MEKIENFKVSVRLLDADEEKKAQFLLVSRALIEQLCFMLDQNKANILQNGDLINVYHEGTDTSYGYTLVKRDHQVKDGFWNLIFVLSNIGTYEGR